MARSRTKTANGETTEDTLAGTIILLNSLGTYAMKLTKERKQFQLLQRKLYEERTEIPNPFAKEGEPQVKVYEAGEYGPWVDAPRPFPAGPDAAVSAVNWVITWLACDEASRHDVLNLETFIEYLELSKQDVLSVVKQVGLKQ